MRQLLKFFKGNNIHSILDVGTGSGQFIKDLQIVFPEAEYCGVDPSSEGFEEENHQFDSSKVRFEAMGAEKLDFEDNSFDLVSLSNALHHLPELQKSLQEMKRVIKPEGWIIISELFSDNLNPAQGNQKFYHHTKSYIDRLMGRFHHETWTREEILKIVSENGLTISCHFDFINQHKMISETQDVDFWVERFKLQIEETKGLSEYNQLLSQVDQFKNQLEENGMEHATNLVLVGQFI